MKALLFAVALVTLAGFTSAAAAAPPEKANEVHAQGCVQAAAEGRCIVLKDVESGKMYNLLIKGAGPDIGTGIAIIGMPTPYNSASVCKQGEPVQVTSWTRKDFMKCSKTRTRSAQ